MNTKKVSSVATRDCPDAIELLMADHDWMIELFRQYEIAGTNGRRQRLARRVCTAFIVHSILDEELFHPACLDAGIDEHILHANQLEQDCMKMLVREIRRSCTEPRLCRTLMALLREYLGHQIATEEAAGVGLFSHAWAAGVDLNMLGRRMQLRRRELMTSARAAALEISPLSILDRDTIAPSGARHSAVVPRKGIQSQA